MEGNGRKEGRKEGKKCQKNEREREKERKKKRRKNPKTPEKNHRFTKTSLPALMRPQSKRRRQRGPPEQARHLIRDVCRGRSRKQGYLQGGARGEKDAKRQRSLADLGLDGRGREQNSAVRSAPPP